MLPTANRLRNSSDFSAVVARGRRVGGSRLVVHHREVYPDGGGTAGTGTSPRVGFVVSRAVGSSVTRHRVTRRLRAQVSARIDRLGAGSRTVVRALPASATASSAQLGADLDRALARLAGRP